MKFLISIILIVVAIAIIIGFGYDSNEYEFKLNKGQSLAIIPLLAALVMSCITFVSANTVGVKYSAFSGTSKETLDE